MIKGHGKYRKVVVFIQWLCCAFLLASCVLTYKDHTERVHRNVSDGNLDKALKVIDKTVFLKRERNKLLYYLEKGLVLHLKKDYKKSNEYLNQADAFLENTFRSVQDFVGSVALNPGMKTYLGEDFEKVAIHYYKTLNYIALKDYDAALVESKRVNLRLEQINLKYPPDKKNRYNTDAFAVVLQGLIYESVKDYNNAFIAYRNAVDLFLENGGSFFGVKLPSQLADDLLGMADKMGFKNEYDRYQKRLSYPSKPKKYPDGSLLLFWESGRVPYKSQDFYNFIGKGFKDDVFYVANSSLGLVIPLSEVKRGEEKSIDIIRVAFPKYVSQPPEFFKASVKNNATEKEYAFELLEDYDFIAHKTLKDRTLRELGALVLRTVTKKYSEYALKKENEDLGDLLGLFNALTESADTRNWQLLPRSINYVRIPLAAGSNEINIEMTNHIGGVETKTLYVQGEGKMVIKSFQSF